MARVSIITALHNCVELTQKYVETLLKTMEHIDWELILIDDCSTDETPNYLKTLDKNPRINCFRNQENLGFSASNNFGARHATSEILAFLNNDLELTMGWFDPMQEILKSDPSTGIVGNIQINPTTKLIDHAGVFFGLDGMPRQARKNRKRAPQTTYTEWNAVTAACMLIRAKDFHLVGGFSEDYRNGFEDIDLCVKLKNIEKRHFVANKSQIIHRVSASPGRHKNNDRNSDLFRERWTSITKEWGKKDWAPEYIQRYKRHWWKFNLCKWILAQKQLTTDLFKKDLNYRG